MNERELRAKIKVAEKKNDAVALQSLGEDLLDRADSLDRWIAGLIEDRDGLRAEAHRVLAVAGRLADEAEPEWDRQRLRGLRNPVRSAPGRGWMGCSSARCAVPSLRVASR